MRLRRTPCMAAPRGQSLVEFLVLSLALVPLFLLVPMIGKYQDLAHATQMASRYIAFEATIRNDGVNSFKPEAQLAAEIRRRFFSNADAPVKTGDTASNVTAAQNPLWSDPQGAPLIKQFDSDVTLSFGAAAGASHNTAMSSASDGQPFLLANGLDLPSKGIYTANVDVTLANLPAGIKSLQPFDAINLKIRRHTSVVIDPWTASQPQQIETKINHLARLPPVMRDALPNFIGSTLSSLDIFQIPPPHIGDLSLWRDVVPADRLPKP